MTPSVPLDPGCVRAGAIRQSAHADAGCEQARGLLILAETQSQVRDPHDYLRDQGRVPHLGRRLAGRSAIRAGLTEILGEVAEHVVCYRADVCLLPCVAQQGCRDAELPARLVVVAGPAGEFRPREGQLSQRTRPGHPFRVALRLG